MFPHPHHDHQGRFGRILGTTAVITVLSIVTPVRADAAGRTGSAGVWRWLQGLWGDGSGAVIRDWTAAAPAASPSPATRAQDTVCPPVGCPVGAPGPPPPSQGGATDPDGRPH